MNHLRLAQASLALGLAAICLWANLSIPAALLALVACAYVALAAKEPRHG